MSWYERVKLYYKNGLWDIQRVRNVVGKVINEQEYREITGSDYDA